MLLLMLLQLLVGRVHYERCRIHNLLVIVSVTLTAEAIHGLILMATVYGGAFLTVVLLILMILARGRLIEVVAGDTGCLICRLLLLIASSGSVITEGQRSFTLVCFVGFIRVSRPVGPDGRGSSSAILIFLLVLQRDCFAVLGARSCRS